MRKEQGSTQIPNQQPESTEGGSRAVVDLTDEINGKTFLLRPLLRMMHEQVERFTYDPEKDACAAEAIEALDALINAAETNLTAIKQLCDDAQLAARKGGA